MRQLSLVIPVYGPLEMLRGILAHVPDLKAVSAECGFDLVETVVVDDGCPQPIDGSEFGSPGELPLVVMRNGRNRGKGYSVRSGVLAAKGGWVLMSDVDESAPLTEFAALSPFALSELRDGRYPVLDVAPAEILGAAARRWGLL